MRHDVIAILSVTAFSVYAFVIGVNSVLLTQHWLLHWLYLLYTLIHC